jgi:hypothetical protein
MQNNPTPLAFTVIIYRENDEENGVFLSVPWNM